MQFDKQLKDLLIHAAEIHDLSNSLSSYNFADDRCALNADDHKEWNKLKDQQSELSSFAQILLNQIKTQSLKKWMNYLKELIKKLNTLENALNQKVKESSASHDDEFNLVLIPDLKKTLEEELQRIKTDPSSQDVQPPRNSYSIWWALTVSNQLISNE